MFVFCILFMSAEEVMFLLWFVCLPVNGIAQNLPIRFPWILVAGCGMGRGRTHYIYMGQIHEFSFHFAKVVRYSIWTWQKSSLNNAIHFKIQKMGVKWQSINSIATWSLHQKDIQTFKVVAVADLHITEVWTVRLQLDRKSKNHAVDVG